MSNKGHVQKIRGVKATSTFPGFETCRILMVDHNNKLWGLPVTQNQLFVQRLFKTGKARKRKWWKSIMKKKSILIPRSAEYNFIDGPEATVKHLCAVFNYPYELLLTEIKKD